MSLFECPRCDYSTDMKSSMKTHINRKVQCKIIKEDINLIEYEELILNKSYNFTIRKIPCTCGLEFVSKDDHYNHVIICKKQNDTKIDKLEKELKEIKTLVNSKMGSNNILGSNNIGSVTININLTPYNDPNLKNVEKYYKESIKKAFMSVPTLIERIHFNEKMPENHNILMSNFRSKVLKVFNGKKWETIDEDKLIDELIDANERALEDWAEDDVEKMKYIERYKKIKERDGEENVNNDLKTEVKKVLYDNRKMIKIKN